MAEYKKDFSRYLFFAIIFFLIFLSYQILKPYLIILISAFILAYLLKPVYKSLSNKIGENLSALTCILIVFLVVLIPLSAVIGGLTNQIYVFLNSNGDFLNNISFSFKNIEKFGISLDKILQQGAEFTASLLTSAVFYIPSLVISAIILLFGIYYILIEWDLIARELRKYIIFKNKEKFVKELGNATKGIIYGSLLIAIIEFAVASAGFYISGVKFYFLLPSVIFFLAFIPGLGPTIVWVPMALYYLFVKEWLIFSGVLITGIILSVYIDTILRTKILGGKSKINPLVMLVGILGGISLFGIFGFVIGPLILVYTLRILKELSSEFR